MPARRGPHDDAETPPRSTTGEHTPPAGLPRVPGGLTPDWVTARGHAGHAEGTDPAGMMELDLEPDPDTPTSFIPAPPPFGAAPPFPPSQSAVTPGLGRPPVPVPPFAPLTSFPPARPVIPAHAVAPPPVAPFPPAATSPTMPPPGPLLPAIPPFPPSASTLSTPALPGSAPGAQPPPFAGSAARYTFAGPIAAAATGWRPLAAVPRLGRAVRICATVALVTIVGTYVAAQVDFLRRHSPGIAPEIYWTPQIRQIWMPGLAVGVLFALGAMVLHRWQQRNPRRS